ncbi:hypothetical protein [Nostoc sp. GT001]|uniref:hypothetical protein n=1 Tax=Nostoc sp. GT001 TaxID=3056647 RepID=UPI0025AB1A31|nr:hypothetical protein [Nostoc sp. GT001]MDM9583970.1 hypothetical protein [Nostoc sp. GT001]
MEEQLEAFVNALEKEIPENGIIEKRYLDYLTENFHKQEITLILRNLGVKKLDKNEYDAAISIFATAINYDRDNPYLHLFYGMALCKLPETMSIKNAKEEFNIAKKLIEKEKPSDYREKHLSILKKYLDYYKYSPDEVFMPKNKKQPKVQQDFHGPVYGVVGNVEGDFKNYPPEQRQNLAEAAAEIQQLINQLAQTNPTTDVVTKEIDQKIKQNPKLKERLKSALEAGGLEALKAIFNHPTFSIPVETIKGFLEA